jgi:hypothetical protein
LINRAQARPSAARTRSEALFADDVVTTMRAYSGRIEQILLDLGEAALTAVGVSMGASFQTRASHLPPRPDLEDIAVSDVAHFSFELSRTVRRCVELYRDRLVDQVDEAIAALQSRIDGAIEYHRLGERHVCERTKELELGAHRLDDMAEKLDWMIPVDGDTLAQ